MSEPAPAPVPQPPLEQRVRTARPGDAATIADFNRRLARETEHRELDPGTIQAGVEALLANPALGTYYVCEQGGRVTGQLMVTYEWSDWRNGLFWWIQSVYVLPESRRQGVFRRLFSHVLDLSRSTQGICGIRLYMENNNSRAAATYAALGFHPTPYQIQEIDFTRPATPAS